MDDELSKLFEYNSGVKQGCKLAPTLFGIYAAVLLLVAFKDIKHGRSILIRFRTDGKFFDLRRLKAKSKVMYEFIREAQYADDIAVMSDSAEGLQELLDAYNAAAKRFGLRINAGSTTMYGSGGDILCRGNTPEECRSLQVSWQLCYQRLQTASRAYFSYPSKI